jgi:four helix bundle protein
MKTEILHFWDLETWKRANESTKQIYQLTKAFPKQERYGITDQLRRASSSIGANIAEGFDRYHFNDKKKFYYYARGST